MIKNYNVKIFKNEFKIKKIFCDIYLVLSYKA